MEHVTGTGEGGRITRKDLQQLIDAGNVPTKEATSSEPVSTTAVAQPSSSAPQEKPAVAQVIQAGDIEIPVTKVRRAIANNMVRSAQEVPHAWMMMEVDVTDLVAYRDSIKTEFKQKKALILRTLRSLSKQLHKL